MTKTEYLQALKNALRNYPEDFQVDIIEAFEGHFEEGFENGETEEQIIQSLGSVDEVVENIQMISGAPKPKQQTTYSSKDHINENMQNIGNNLKDLLTSVTDLVNESITQATENISSREGNNISNDETIRVVNGEQYTNIDIRGKDVDVRFEPGDVLQYIVHPLRNLFKREELVYNESSDGDTFKIHFSKGSARITVIVPEDVRNIDCSLNNGDLHLEKLRLEKVNLKNLNGDINLEEASIKQFNCSNNNGDIYMENTEFNAANLFDNNGDITMNVCRGSLTMKTNNGDVDINDFDGEQMVIEGNSGDIDFEGSTSIGSFSTKAGDIDVDVNGPFDLLNVSCIAGDIRAYIENRDYVADVKTITGDITNSTGMPTYNVSRHEQVISDGNSKVLLKTVSGDINIR